MTLGDGGQNTFRVGECLVEPLANTMTFNGQQVVLRTQVMELLVYLASRNGGVASLENMHDELWRGRVVSTGTIYNCIAELRHAFNELHPTFNYIRTIPKKGYRLAASVVQADVPAGRAPGEPTVVAILPLRNRSDPEDEYLCDGISEEILHSLTQVVGLRVVSALAMKDMQCDNREVGRRFEADSVLAGGLQRSGNTLRLSFRLEDVASGQVLWSEHCDHQLSDIFEIQENVAREVVEALTAHSGSEISSAAIPGDSGTRSSQALNDFLLGRHALSVGTVEEYATAIAHFDRAIERDPCFARAYYCLYLACYFLGRYQRPGTELMARATEAAARAREFGYRPAVPWIHIHRRLHKDARIDTVAMGREAVARFRDRDPEWCSFAYEQMTWVLSASGFFESTVEFARRVLDSPTLNFQDSDVDEDLRNWEGGAGHFDAAIQKLSSLIHRAPRVAMYRHERSILYSRIGDFDKAREEIGTLQVQGASTRNTEIAYAYWQGDQDTVRKRLARLTPADELHPKYECINHAMVGDMASAADLFYQATDTKGEFAFVDLGFMRARIRCCLPQTLVAELESQPLFQAMLENEGIDRSWRAWLKAELNSIRAITGVEVKYDHEY